MKKIMTFLVGLSVVTTSSLSIISCKKSKLKEDQFDLEPNPDHQSDHDLIKEFNDKIENIFRDHNGNIRTNLYEGSSFAFINKENIEKYAGKMKDLIDKDNDNFEKFKQDLRSIFKINELKQKINELKNDKKFDPILKDIKEIFNGINVLPTSNFEFGKVDNENFIGTIKISYAVKYKCNDNDKPIEKTIDSRMLEFTYTKNKDFINSLDEFQKHIENDLILANKSTFIWEEIKGSKQDYDGCGNFSNEIKANSNKFIKDELLDFIKNKYFKNLDSFDFIDVDNIKVENLNFKVNFINVFENLTAKNFINLKNGDDPKKMFEIIFRKDPINEDNISESIEILENLYFNDANMKLWNSKFLELRNNYLKNNGFKEDEIKNIDKYDNYKNLDSIGKIEVSGLKISFKINGHDYKHVLPNFKLNLTYNITNDSKKKKRLLSEFTLRYLIKNFQDELVDEDKRILDFDHKLVLGRLLYIKDKYKKILQDNSNLIDRPKFPASFSGLFHILNSNFINTENIKKQKINEIINNDRRYYFLRENYSNVIDYNYFDDGGAYNSRVTPKFYKNYGITLAYSEKGNKDKLADSITFKLGYLAVNIKHKKLFELSHIQPPSKERYFIQFKT